MRLFLILFSLFFSTSIDAQRNPRIEAFETLFFGLPVNSSIIKAVSYLNNTGKIKVEGYGNRGLNGYFIESNLFDVNKAMEYGKYPESGKVEFFIGFENNRITYFEVYNYRTCNNEVYKAMEDMANLISNRYEKKQEGDIYTKKMVKSYFDINNKFVAYSYFSWNAYDYDPDKSGHSPGCFCSHMFRCFLYGKSN